MLTLAGTRAPDAQDRFRPGFVSALSLSNASC
jgi:hypothetical protein